MSLSIGNTRPSSFLQPENRTFGKNLLGEESENSSINLPEPDSFQVQENTFLTKTSASSSEQTQEFSKPQSKTDSFEPSSSSSALTPEEQEIVQKLKEVDAKVRAHEAAHQAAAGGLARGKSFGFQTGPDGKQYATSGEVQIDTSAIPNDPEATVRKMQQVRRAALAPADPSPQDLSVASAAVQNEAEAAKQSRQQNSQTNKQSENTNSSNQTTITNNFLINQFSDDTSKKNAPSNSAGANTSSENLISGTNKNSSSSNQQYQSTAFSFVIRQNVNGSKNLSPEDNSTSAGISSQNTTPSATFQPQIPVVKPSIFLRQSSLYRASSQIQSSPVINMRA